MPSRCISRRSSNRWSNDDYGNTVYKTAVFKDKDGSHRRCPQFLHRQHHRQSTASHRRSLRDQAHLERCGVQGRCRAHECWRRWRCCRVRRRRRWRSACRWSPVPVARSAGGRRCRSRRSGGPGAGAAGRAGGPGAGAGPGAPVVVPAVPVLPHLVRWPLRQVAVESEVPLQPCRAASRSQPQWQGVHRQRRNQRARGHRVSR